VKTKLNPWIWLFIMIGFFVMLFELVIIGCILFFLHPRMVKFVYFALTVLLILTISQLFHLYKTYKKSKYEPIKWGHIIYLVPLVLALFRPTYLSAEMLANKHISLGERPVTFQNDLWEDLADDEEDYIPPMMLINDEFLRVVDDLQMNLVSRVGTEVELVGFVFKTPTLSEKQFVVARLLITCCTADAGVVGILVEGERGITYTSDTWVRVVGRVEKHVYTDSQMGYELELPKLMIVSIEEIEPLPTPYIYP